MSELKPCPFCGEPPTELVKSGLTQIRCNNPQCWIAPATSLYTDRKTAIEAWECRAQPEHIGDVNKMIAQPDNAPLTLAWIPVADKMPEDDKPVLAFGHAVNNRQHSSIFKGRWIAEHTMISADFGADDDMHLIYDETEDEYYVPEGWFERLENWDDFTDVAVGDYVITHWMPLPEPPETEGGDR